MLGLPIDDPVQRHRCPNERLAWAAARFLDPRTVARPRAPESRPPPYGAATSVRTSPPQTTERRPGAATWAFRSAP